MNCTQCNKEFKTGEEAVKMSAGNVTGKETVGKDIFVENSSEKYQEGAMLQCIACTLHMAMALQASPLTKKRDIL